MQGALVSTYLQLQKTNIFNDSYVYLYMLRDTKPACPMNFMVKDEDNMCSRALQNSVRECKDDLLGECKNQSAEIGIKDAITGLLMHFYV